MEQLVKQARHCMEAGLYLPAFISYLVIPDAAGAVEYQGRPSERYVRWVDTFVDRSSYLDGNMAWALRNAVMHEVRTDWKTKTGFDMVQINLPNSRNILVHGGGCAFDDPTIPTLYTNSLEIMARGIEDAASAWLRSIAEDADKKAKLDSLLQIRLEGTRLCRGIPCIA